MQAGPWTVIVTTTRQHQFELKSVKVANNTHLVGVISTYYPM